MSGPHRMRSYDELVSDAAAAEVDGWGFDWLDERATEQRPPWGYSALLAQRLAEVDIALDIDTGGGEVLDEVRDLPSSMWATESWPSNAALARDRLGPRGVQVVATVGGDPLPFADETFDLVTARHPVRPDWGEIHRVLRPGGHYFAKHVGPESVFELIEFFVGELPESARQGLRPDREVALAERAGLRVEDLQVARCRMEFHDIGAVG